MEKERIQKAISEMESFVISSHVSPDPDAIGSVFALSIFLERMGKKVLAYVEDIPYFCEFLPRPSSLMLGGNPPSGFDVAVSLDCENKGRLPEGFIPAFDSSSLTISIDHHRSTEPFAHINYSDPSAPSTGVMVYRVIKDLGPLDLDVARNIYTTVVGDTGSFRYSSATPEAFSVAMDMVSLGVSPWEISENLYENHPKERVLLLKKALDTLTFLGGGSIGFMYLLYRDLEPFGGMARYLTDGFVNVVRGIKGVEMAIFAKEWRPGELKLSIRGKGSMDVSEFARIFGGGGHKNAAGCTIKGDAGESIERVIREAERFAGGWVCSGG